MREELGTEPAALMTTVTEDYGRVSTHGVRRELVEAQAAAAGLALVEVGIPAAASNEVYEERMAAALAADAARRGRDRRLCRPLPRRHPRLPRRAPQRDRPRDRLPALGTGHRPTSPGASSTPASRRSSSASIPRSSTPPSPAAPLTSRCSPICPPASIPAARTASSTPSSTPVRSSPRPIAVERGETASCATASSSPTSPVPRWPEERHNKQVIVS